MKAGPDRDSFLRWMDECHPGLDREIVDRLVAFGELIRGAHPRMGLVSRGDRERVLTRHVRECAEPALLDRFPESSRVVDVGTGAGLPGIPVALLRPDLQVTLIEPREKRVGFLERVRLVLGLESLAIHEGTIENVARKNPEAGWDVAVSRALRWKPAMVEVLGSILPPSGILVRMGSSEVPDGVSVTPIEPEGARVVQVWPRNTWPVLPEAR